MNNPIQELVALGSKTRAIAPGDEIYLENRVRALIGDQLNGTVSKDPTVEELLDQLTKIAIENQKIEDSITNKEILASQLMDLVTPLPSVINHHFQKLLKTQNSRVATEYFYRLCRLDNDIQTAAIAKNVEYTAAGLEVTINLSKPEKDPKAIAQAAHANESTYPQCQLCLENEGYRGRVGYPARSNHRVIQIQVNDEPWGFQYSPYAYFPEHAIFIDRKHRPMKINRQTFANLIQITNMFPDYFVGSNADLPIVGGSMLSHEHYQGGRHVFPMMKAPIRQKVELSAFPNVTVGVVEWPMTVLRLRGQDQDALIEAANHIHKTWMNYSDETLELRAYTGETRHHTVTPIAYRDGDDTILDIVLRDNQTSDAYPDGIFHPHKDVQHIKKENIGLIEVMGRAIFPPRLIPEMEEVRKFLLGQAHQIADYHLKWAEHLRQVNEITNSTVEAVIQEGIGTTFHRVLEDAGVFKNDSDGKKGLNSFLQKLE